MHQQQQANTTPQSESTFEELVKQMAENNLQFQQRTQASIQNLENQIGQLANSLNQIQSQGSDKLPAQTVVNPRNANVSAITLRSGKTVDTPNCKLQQATKKEAANKEKEGVPESSSNRDPSSVSSPPSVAVDEQQSIPLPFPQRVVQKKIVDEVDKDKEILETFRKVEVNIPLLEAIKQIPRYAKFLKELCTHKRKIKGVEQKGTSKTVLALRQTDMPEKCKDPGTFTVPCTIGNSRFDHALIDLGAAINVMPYSVYSSLRVGPLKPTDLMIQLADGSPTNISGIIEDVLVKIDKLIFPADFYVVNMTAGINRASLILGRPFLKTAKTKIDVSEGTLSMEFGDHIMHFNIYDTLKESQNVNPPLPSVHNINLIDPNASTEMSLAALDEPLHLPLDFIASTTCTDCTDGSCSICVEIEACLQNDSRDIYTCDACTDSEICSVCAEIEAYIRGDFDASDASCDGGAVINSTRLECKNLITTSTDTSNLVELQASEQYDASIDVDLGVLAESLHLPSDFDFTNCTNCLDGSCSVCAEIDAAIASVTFTPPTLQQPPFMQQPFVESPPKPPDLKVLVGLIDIVFSISGSDVAEEYSPHSLNTFAQVIVPQDYELPLTARQPPDPGAC